MKLIVAVDDKMGMSFNKRRQSKDKTLRERILNLVGDNKLYVTNTTFRQFNESNDELDIGKLVIDENPMKVYSENDYCFIENIDVAPYEDNFDEIVIYYWNRVYPRDLTFKIDLSNWECVSTYEFVGNSHKNIKECVYRRKENACEKE